MLPEAIEAMTAQLARSATPRRCTPPAAAAGRSSRSPARRSPQALGARPSEVIFTSGGTESDNLAVKGIFWARRDADRPATRILVSAVEHHAVLDSRPVPGRRTRAPRSSGSRSTPSAVSTPSRSRAPSRPSPAGRARQRDVGQQRGRHRAAGRRDRRRGARARRAGAHRRRPGRRPGRGRLRRAAGST